MSVPLQIASACMLLTMCGPCPNQLQAQGITPQGNFKSYDSKTRLEELNATARGSCLARGGFDCEQGADSDGSVICQDGYNDSAERYEEFCKGSRISVEHWVEFVGGDRKRVGDAFPRGVRKPLADEILKLVSTVRNESAVEAEGISLEVFLPYLADESLQYNGAKKVPAYEFVELSLPANSIPLERGAQYLGEMRFNVECGNCVRMRSRK